jgi:hypothetical protein
MTKPAATDEIRARMDRLIAAGFTPAEASALIAAENTNAWIARQVVAKARKAAKRYR